MFVNVTFIIFNICRVTPSLKKRLLSAYNLESKGPIVWGITHEKNAVDAYTAMKGTVSETGSKYDFDDYFQHGTLGLCDIKKKTTK